MLEEVKKFFKDSDASLSYHNQIITTEENAFIALDLDEDRVDTLLETVVNKEEKVNAADNFVDD